MSRPTTIWMSAIAVLSIASSSRSAPLELETPTRLEDVRGVISRARAGTRTPADRLLGKPLDGFSFAYDMDVEEKLVVVSFNRRGLVMRFDQTGVMTSSVETDEIRSVQMLDPEGLGHPLLLVEVVTNWGNGVLGKTYRLYAVDAGELRLRWSGLSLDYREGLASHPGLRRDLRGFVRVDQGGGLLGGPRLVSVVEDRLMHTFRTRTFEWVEGRLVEAPGGK